ncbi:phage head morphogenesis protein [Pseudomonas sp. dw_358]|uniref:phage head morphogenesis protein n=1 Tax=Pseudomonas sp. dw_358 TaxID=2720083 RepID=UPI001BD1DBA7|nr:phage head morphogenesis protein [Pseudomonas sp. dw_358]
MAMAVRDRIVPTLQARWDIESLAPKAMTRDAGYADLLVELIASTANMFLNIDMRGSAYQPKAKPAPSKRRRGPRVAPPSPAEEIALHAVEMAADEADDHVVKELRRTVRIDAQALMTSEGVNGYIDAMVSSNVALIKTIPQEFFSDVEQTVLNAYSQGLALKPVLEQLQEKVGVSARRAKVIAVDQMNKVNSDVERRRMLNIGITRFKWSTSKDERVSGNPSGLYPNAKVKCFKIALQDTGMGPGVYSLKDGAKWDGESELFPGRAHVKCRCTFTPQIEGFDY